MPAGKRLIVETVSALASDIEGVNYHLRLSARAAGAPDLSFLLTTKGVFHAATIPEKGRAAVTASATFIVEPEDELTYRFVRDVTTSPEEGAPGSRWWDSSKTFRSRTARRRPNEVAGTSPPPAPRRPAERWVRVPRVIDMERDSR